MYVLLYSLFIFLMGSTSLFQVSCTMLAFSLERENVIVSQENVFYQDGEDLIFPGSSYIESITDDESKL